uniref:Serine/threonine-protein phosphatase n=1 Tax=Neogobius melanostomus TaxID=47308 RepID=A0A8C6S5A9_9GOBI
STCVSLAVKTTKAIRSAVLIQRWYRQYVARLEMRRRCTWNIFQSIEYAGEQDQIKLYKFFSYLMDHFTPTSKESDLISHLFRENDICRDIEWERYFCYRSIDVPDTYAGPHLTFPLTFCGVSRLVEALKHKHQLHARYVLQLLGETWRLLRMLPNITHVTTNHAKEITICGDLHGHLEDLLLIFYKNGLPASERAYVFNGDFVDRGKNSLEILLILFGFLLVYPNDVHLNRGNHEDHMVNLRYGFTKEVLGKYRVHGKKILKLIHKIFSWLPLATVIDHKVLVVHGGISDTTDLDTIVKVDRHKYVSVLRPPKSRKHSAHNKPHVSNGRTKNALEPDVGRKRVNSLTYCHPNTSQRQDIPRRSDPMSQNGCIPNEVRGGGCYWGPDVTEKVLSRHKLHLLIRSHECKQEGYEFCHNHKVNYYIVLQVTFGLGKTQLQVVCISRF